MNTKIDEDWNFDPLHWIDRIDRQATMEEDIKAMQKTMVRDGVVYRAVPDGYRDWYKWVPEDQIKRRHSNRKSRSWLNILFWILLFVVLSIFQILG